MSRRSSSRGAARRAALLLLAAHAALCAAPAALAGAAIPFAEDLFPGLRQLIDQAAAGSTEARLGGLRVEEREGDLQVARGQRRPSVRFNTRVLGSYETREDIDDAWRGSVDAHLAAAQPLYQWGNLERQETIARHRRDAEVLESGRGAAQQVMQLRRSYLQWLLMQERRTVLRQSIDLWESSVDARRRMAEAGQVSGQDALEMEARLLETRESLAYAEKMITELEGALARLSGAAPPSAGAQAPSLAVIEPLSPAGLAGLAALVNAAQARDSDPAVRRFALYETIEAEQLAVLDKRNWPTLDFVTGIFTDSIESINQSDPVYRVQYYAGLQVNWNIFDSWQTDGLKRGTLARKRAHALRRVAAAEEWSQRAGSLLAELQLNLTQLEARAKRQTLLERRLALLREQAGENRVTGAELLQGEIDFLDVRQRLMEARVNYLNNLMELGALLGMDPAAPAPSHRP